MKPDFADNPKTRKTSTPITRGHKQPAGHSPNPGRAQYLLRKATRPQLQDPGIQNLLRQIRQVKARAINKTIPPTV
jgi:hypothetical protein